MHREKTVRVAVAQFALVTALASAMVNPSGFAAAQDKPGTLALPEKKNFIASSQSAADPHVKEGIRLAGEEKLSQAAEQFVEALRINPQNTDALYNLGLIRMRWGDFKAAESSFREVLRINPNSDAAQLRLASILTEFARDDQNYIPQAAAAYARAIELSPTNPEAYFNLGYLAVRKRDYPEAADRYRKTLDLDPHYPHARLDLGIALYHGYDFEGAYPELRAAATEEPDSAEAHHYLGLVLSKRTQWEEAIQELRAAVRLDPGDPEIHYALAVALRKAGHPGEADAEMVIVEGLQAHSSEKTRARFRDYQAQKSIEAGELDGAIDSYRQSLGLAKDARTATNLGVALLWRGDADGAIKALQNALGLDPKYAWADYYLGVAYARKHDYARAEGALNEALKLRPELSEAEFYRGLVYAAQGRFPQAESDLRSAVRSRPDAAATHYYLGSVLMQLGKEKEAKAEIETARRLDPGFKPDQAMNSSRPAGIEKSP